MSLRNSVFITMLAISVAAPVPASAAPVKTKARSAKSGKRAKQVAAALAEARAQRAEVVAEARALAGRGDPQAGAARLVEAAVILEDPALTIEAADVYYSLRTKESALQALRLISGAREALAGYVDPELDASVEVGSIRLSADDVAALQARCDVLDEQATALHQKIAAREGVETRARKRVRAGAVLTGVGVAGFGLLAGGLAVRADREAKLAPIRGEEELYDLSSLDAQRGRATGMMAAGVATGVLGLVVGGVLLGLGLRELKRGGSAGRHARVQVAPTTAGLLVVGRF